MDLLQELLEKYRNYGTKCMACGNLKTETEELYCLEMGQGEDHPPLFCFDCALKICTSIAPFMKQVIDEKNKRQKK